MTAAPAAPAPPAQDDLIGHDAGDPPAEPQPAPQAPQEGRETKGIYMVLWAPVPREDAPEARYREIGHYRGASDKRKGGAGDPGTAKRRAMADRKNPQVQAAIGAAESGGILLRAVPASSWPADVEPTGYERPEPRFVVR